MSGEKQLSGTARSDPTWTNIYLQLFLVNTMTEGMVAHWFLKHGYPELTVCPICQRTEFWHKDNCAMPQAVRAIKRMVQSPDGREVVQQGIDEAAATLTDDQQEQLREALKRKQ